jgi:hypothetical protein
MSAEAVSEGRSAAILLAELVMTTDSMPETLSAVCVLLSAVCLHAGCWLLVSGFWFLICGSCCLLPAACCLLPAACCLLPAACSPHKHTQVNIRDNRGLNALMIAARRGRVEVGDIIGSE